MAEPQLLEEEKIKDIADVSLDGFDMDKALNTDGFTEFLAQGKEPVEPADSEAESIKQKFEVFQVKETVRSEIKKIYADQISQEMGIKLEAADLACVDKFLSAEALDHPERILELNDKIKQFRELPGQIKNLENELGSLANDEDWPARVEELKSTREKISIMQKNAFSVKGVLSMFMDVDKAKETFKTAMALKKEGVSLHMGDINIKGGEIDREIAEITKVLHDIQAAEDLKSIADQRFGDLRKELLGGMGDMAELTAIINRKAVAELKSLASGKNLEAYSKTQTRFESLRDASMSTLTNIDIFKGLDPEKFQNDLDALIEERAMEEVMLAVKKARLGGNSLTNMESALGSFMRSEKFGSKEGEEAKMFIEKTIFRASRRLGDSIEDRSKKILLARIYNKLIS